MLSKAALSFAYTNSLGWAPLETRELRGYGGSWDGEGVGAGFQKTLLKSLLTILSLLPDS